jgi:two-component sensor histidine kinase
MMRLKQLRCLLIFSALLQFTTVAQSRFFTFNRYSTENGMTSNKVFCTYQDAKGFIWIGSNDGLMRFDGTKFVIYADRKGDMPFSAISAIIPLSATEFILSFPEMKEVGIFNVANLSYTKVRIAASQQIPTRSGMYVFKNGGDVFMLFGFSPIVLRFDPEKKIFSPFQPFTVPAGWNIMSMYYDPVEKNHWFSCDSGLAVYSIPDKKMYSRNNNPHHWGILTESKINDGNWTFFIDSKRRYWILNWPSYSKGTEMLYCYDAKNNQFLSDTAGWRSSIPQYREIRHFTETTDGIIWAYGTNGLLSRIPETGKFENNKDDHTDNFGIKYETIYNLMQDKEDGIWVCTDQGLYFSPPANNNILNLISQDKVPVTAICQLEDGRILLNTWGSGTKTLELLNFNIISRDLYPKINNDYGVLSPVWCSHQHSKTKKVYIGAQGGWLGIYDPVTNKTSQLQDSAFDNRTIRCITELPNGDLVFATQGGRLVKFSNNHFQTIFNCETVIYSLVADKQNNVWAGTHNKGLFLVDAMSGKQLLQIQNTGPVGKTIHSNIVNHLLFYKDSLLLAANGKLSLINTRTGAVKNIGMKEGMPSNSIQAMQVDNSGNIWLITSSGLCRYNIAANIFTRFGSKDGFTDPTLMEGPSAKLNNSMLMFVGKDGQMMIFAPDSLNSSNTPFDVAITDIRIGNDYYPVDSLLALPEITCSYSNNSITISFSSLSYLQGDKLVYYYKMQGLEDNWKVLSSGALRAIYSYLPPGHYIFQVRAESINGLASDNTTSIKIYIKPPFWRNYWFISTILFFIALFFYGLHKLRVNKLLAVEKLRNRVARDLHDDMGSTLSTINILSAMAKSKLHSDSVKTSEYIGKISENSQRMMEAMDDIVWSIKPMNDSMQRIAARMREFALNVLEAKDMEVSFTVEDKVYDIKLDMEARRDFFLIFKEAINNAAKYSKATHVTVNLTTAGNMLMMEVKDDGKGFDVNEASDGNGMGNMQKRADSLKAKLNIQSHKDGGGTNIKLTVPTN